MKNRLQIKYYMPSFWPYTRENAVKYITDLFSRNTTSRCSLPGEPIAVFYGENSDSASIILAIGRGGDGKDVLTNKPYYLIDFSELKNSVLNNKENIDEISETLEQVLLDVDTIYTKINDNATNIKNINTKIGSKTDGSENTVFGYINNKVFNILGETPVIDLKTISELGSAVSNLRVQHGSLNNTVESLRDAVRTQMLYSSNNDITIVSRDLIGTDVKVNIDGNTIVRNTENGSLEVNPEAFTKYVGNGCIQITDAENVYNTKKVSVKVSEDDVIMVDTPNGIFANLSLRRYKSDGNEFIELLGKYDEGGKPIVISQIGVNDFVMDSMIEKIEWDTTDPDNPKILFKFNTTSGKETLELPVKDLMNIYTAGNGLKLDGSDFSIKIDPETNENDYLKVNENGLSFSGLRNVVSRLTYAEEEITSLKNRVEQLEELTDIQSAQITTLLNALANYVNGNNVISVPTVNDIKKTIISEDTFTSTNGDLQFEFDGNGNVDVNFGDDAIFMADYNTTE